MTVGERKPDIERGESVMPGREGTPMKIDRSGDEQHHIDGGRKRQENSADSRCPAQVAGSKSGRGHEPEADLARDDDSQDHKHPLNSATVFATHVSTTVYIRVVPKRIDHRAREREVAEAAWKVLARKGVGKLSVRNVAEEAGLATASLRRAFPTQDTLRAYCLELVRERTRARIDAVDQSLPIAEYVETCLLQLLPLDADRRLEMEVFIAIGVLALTDDVLRGPYGDVHDEIALGCRSLLTLIAGDHPHHAVPGGDIDIECKRLHALVDGLALHLIQQRHGEPTGWAVDIVSTHIRNFELAWRAHPQGDDDRRPRATPKGMAPIADGP